eukprot:1165884-Lingulodinium_polyedra.AAC.1
MAKEGQGRDQGGRAAKAAGSKRRRLASETRGPCRESAAPGVLPVSMGELARGTSLREVLAGRRRSGAGPQDLSQRCGWAG